MKQLIFHRITFLFILLCISLTAADKEQDLNLLPVPADIQLQKGNFILTKNFSIAVTGNPDNRIYQYATRALRRLSGRTGLFFMQDFITPKSNNDTCSMIINCSRPGKVILNEDETYILIISPDRIKLNSETELGALRGMETLLQLLENNGNNYYFPDLIIKDMPRFPWRGLMMDVSRHFMPVEVVKRNLDAMAAVKLNVFHWHLSDDQGVRVESKIFPQIQRLCSDGYYYTQDQIKDIIKYAADRGIRVIPEFDIPGHSTAFLVAFPELASAPGPYKIERNFGVFDPTFNPTIEATYNFFDKFFSEMAELFTDEYFHIGGDENNGKQWNSNNSIQEFMIKNNIPDNNALQAYFNNRILNILTKYGKKIVGWDEILHPDMPTNIVIQSWRGTQALIDASKKGYSGILSNGYYIDLIQPAWYHYLNDPVPDSLNLTNDQKKKILGGETTMWAEDVTPETVDSRIWPRTAAIAERFWAPANVRNVEDMYRRINKINFQLEELGITSIKNQGMMLRRLTNNNEVTALKTFIDVIEPLKIYERHGQGVVYTQQSPYTRVVDAALPESETARKFNLLIDNFLLRKNKNDAEKIKIHLSTWKENHIKLVKTIKTSPILKEIEPASLNLSKISQTGLESLELILSDKSANADWVKKNKNILNDSKKSYGQIEIMIIPGIEKLINAVNK